MAENGDNGFSHAGEEESSSLMEKIAEKLHLNKEQEEEHHKAPEEQHHKAADSSSSSSSDSEREKVKETSSASATASDTTSDIKAKIYRLFGRQKPLHQVLGAGKPADVFLWRNKKISAGVLATGTTIWVLFELLEYHLLTLVCHVLIFAVAVLFLWANATSFISKLPPLIPEISIPEEPFLEFASALRQELNRGFALLHKIATGKEWKKFLGVIAGLWLLSVVGNCFDFLTLCYINFLLLHTLPVLYEKYEDEVDSFAEKAMAEAHKYYDIVNEKYLSKIPRGPLKNRKAD